MGETRVFTEEHVPDVADLYMRAMRGRSGPAGTALQNYFREIFLANPWVSPEIPSLVYFDSGKLMGFLGVVPRSMDFRGRPIRAAILSQFMVDRERHRGLAALDLLRRVIRGPQDLTFSDGAGEGSHIVWTAAGGQAARLYSFNWVRILRPLETARYFLDRKGGAARWLGKASFAAAAIGDLLLCNMPPRVFRPAQPAFLSRQVPAEELFECIQEIGWRHSLKPAYEPSSFRWLMSQAAAARSHGDLRLATVYTPEGVRCGWYVCYVRRGGPAAVMQIGSRRRDQFEAVLLTLFHDAWREGASFVKGQAIPQSLALLTRHHCLFRYPGSGVLVQARDPDLLYAIHSGDAALSRLDGESWLRFATEDWT